MDRQNKSVAELKVRISSGDFKALDELYNSYYKKLKLYGQKFSPKLVSYSVEDSVQELFIWIAQNHRNLKTIDNLEVYMFSALKKNIYQEIQKKDKRQKLKDRFFQTTTSETHENSIEHKLISAEETTSDKSYLESILNALPPQQKEVLYLRHYIGMCFKEIASVMDLSEQVVRNYSHRALKNIRAQRPNHTTRREEKKVD